MKTQVKHLNYEGQQVYVGMDVHKDTWKVATCTQHTSPTNWPVTIRRPFAENLKKYLDRHYPRADFQCAYEAGFCGFWPYEDLQKYGLKTLVVHAADIPTSDKDRQQKNDKRDARKIAKALKNGILQSIYVPSRQTLEDRSIVRERYSIAKSARRIKTQIRSHLALYNIEAPENVDTRYWSRSFIKWLEEIQRTQNDVTLAMQIERLHAMRKLKLRANLNLRILGRTDRHLKIYELLLSVPGIGCITAMLVICEIIDMTRFPRFLQLCSYAGLIPSTYSSGDKERSGDMTNRRNERLRTALIESSWSTIKSDPELKLKYEQLRQRMRSQEAIVRIARILLRRIRCVWLSEQKYRKVEIE